jgi:hypothetical protein
MGHPLKHFNPHNQLGNSADFSQYDIVNDADFTQDKFVMGDFSNYGEELDDELMSGFGEYDEGLGKRRGFKAKIKPKAIVKAISKPAVKTFSSLSKGGLKLGKKFGKRGLKLGGKGLKLGAKLAPTAIINKALPPAIKNELQKAAAVAAVIPGVSQAMAVAQQAAKIADKVGIPATSMVKLVAPQQASVQSESLPDDVAIEQVEHTLVSPTDTPSEVVSQGKPVNSKDISHLSRSSTVNSLLLSQIQKNVHPMVAVHNKITGMGEYDGFFDDLLTKAKTEAAKLYETQKAKLTQTAITQASNLVGKTLDKLNVTDPKAQAALSKTIATATSAATAAAQQTALDKAKQAFEQNKKYLYMAGAGIGALVLFKMLKKK